MEPSQIDLLAEEIYRLTEELGIVGCYGEQLFPQKVEELDKAQKRLSFLQSLVAKQRH